MKTRFLLQNKFKRPGIILSLIGFAAWWWGQLNGAANIIKKIIPAKGEEVTYHPLTENQSAWNIAFLTISFFLFLGGFLLFIFSKEKNEDEYIQRVRLESFQFAALLQLASFVLFFIGIALFQPKNENSYVETFFILTIIFFWLLYILHFNFALYIKPKLTEQHD